jgi:hypothetical protein
MANKHISLATDMHATIKELLESVFSLWFVPKLHSKIDPERAFGAMG